MAAVLQAQDAPAARVLQPADNPDVDIVPLRFGVKYASDAPMLALEYRDKASGESSKLAEIPLAIQDDSKALEVYAALKESHSRFLAPYVVSVAQVVRLIQLAIDNRGKAPSPPRGAFPFERRPRRRRRRCRRTCRPWHRKSTRRPSSRLRRRRRRRPCSRRSHRPCRLPCLRRRRRPRRRARRCSPSPEASPPEIPRSPRHQPKPGSSPSGIE